MCKYCEPLKSCPIGEKRKVQLTKSDSIFEKCEMVVDRYSDHIESFIHAEYTKVDGSWGNMVFDVSYCPKCGEKLN